ncbi:hypothetical protein EON81_09190 [bacterium]|nr:MAG: hypothetical protein EON81_09190 [bacterium]
MAFPILATLVSLILLGWCSPASRGWIVRWLFACWCILGPIVYVLFRTQSDLRASDDNLVPLLILSFLFSVATLVGSVALFLSRSLLGRLPKLPRAVTGALGIGLLLVASVVTHRLGSFSERTLAEDAIRQNPSNSI